MPGFARRAMGQRGIEIQAKVVSLFGSPDPTGGARVHPPHLELPVAKNVPKNLPHRVEGKCSGGTCHGIMPSCLEAIHVQKPYPHGIHPPCELLRAQLPFSSPL